MPAMSCLLFSLLLVKQGMNLHWLLGLFCKIQKHNLNEKRLLLTCPEKSIYDEEVWSTCLIHPCGEPEKTFITALLCADKVSLFIQRGRDKPWMKHCGANREKERDGGKRERTGAQLGFQLPVCAHVSRWHLLENHLCSVRRLEADPLLKPPSNQQQQQSFLPPHAPSLC